MTTCRCGAPLGSFAVSCPRCGARPLAGPPAPQSAVATMVRPVAPPTMAPPRTAPPTLRPVVRPLAPLPHAPAPVAPPAATRTTAGTVWIAAVAGVLIVGLVAAVAVLALRPTSVSVASPAPVTTTRTVVPAPADVSGHRHDTTTTVPDDETTNAALIDEGVAADRAQVETLVGSWVPQLSSKRVGTVADGITYDSAAILEHYNDLSDRYRPVLLLDSGDWPVFRESGYTVVVAARPFATAEQANAWCSAQGLGADDCFAKRLAHSGSSAANTAPRS